MAQHAILTNKSNQRIAAVVAVSGLVGTGFVVPFAQIAVGATVKAGNTCTITSNGSSSTVLRNEIDAAIADVDCAIIVVNSEDGEPLGLDIEGTAIYVGPAEGRTSVDPRNSITIKSTTGLVISPGDNAGMTYTGSLMELEDVATWVSTLNLCESLNCTGTSLFSTITVEGLTLLGSDVYSSINGLDFGNNFGDTLLEIKNSRFIKFLESPGPTRGGAVFTNSNLTISNSSFYANTATQVGGAVWGLRDVFISNSLFADNTAGEGGAAYGSDIYSVNSTYIGNDAISGSSWGGALLAEFDIELVLNTFDGNVDHQDGASAYAWNDIKIWGNIFTSDPTAQQVYGDDNEFDFGYNIFSVNSLGSLNNPSSTTETSREALDFSDEDIQSHFLSGSPFAAPAALKISALSAAKGFVEEAFPTGDVVFPLIGNQTRSFNSFFVGKTSVDQLGNTRGLPLDAGAHQVTIYVQPEERRSNYEAPALAQLSPKEKLVPGFAANSIKLTNPMKKEIRVFLKANPNLKKVECKGYTSSPSTPQDRALARQRGKAACDYILTLLPDAKVTIQSGSHTNKPGSKIRRVSIKIS